MKCQTINASEPSESHIRQQRLDDALKEAGVDSCQFNALRQATQADKVVGLPSYLSDEAILSGIAEMYADKAIALPEAIEREFRVQRLLGNIPRHTCRKGR